MIYKILIEYQLSGGNSRKYRVADMGGGVRSYDLTRKLEKLFLAGFQAAEKIGAQRTV